MANKCANQFIALFYAYISATQTAEHYSRNGGKAIKPTSSKLLLAMDWPGFFTISSGSPGMGGLPVELRHSLKAAAQVVALQKCGL